MLDRSKSSAHVVARAARVVVEALEGRQLLCFEHFLLEQPTLFYQPGMFAEASPAAGGQTTSAVAASEIIIDNSGPGVTTVGTWYTSTNPSGYYGGSYAHENNSGKGSRSITFTSPAVDGATYDIGFWYVATSNRATNTPIDIYTKSGVVTVTVNQKINGSQWFALPGGPYEFDAAVGVKIVIRNGGTTGSVAADAFRLTPTDQSPVAPAAPSGLTATATGPTSVSLSWTDNATNETGHLLQRSTDDGATWADIALNANVTSYVDQALTAETSYLYRVQAFNGAGPSDFDVLDDAVTTPAATPASEIIIDNSGPNVTTVGTWYTSTNPTGYFGASYLHENNGGKGTRSATFTATAVDGAAYNVAVWYIARDTRATNVPIDIYTKTGVVTLSVNQRINGSQWFTLPGGPYEFDAAVGVKIVVRNGSTNGSVAADAFRLTPTNTAPSAPAAPSALQASSVNATTIALSWTDNSSNETGFKIERRIQGTTTFTEITQVGANVKSYTNTGLSSANTYEYRVRATNAVGDSGYSGIASATPADNDDFTVINWSNLNSPSPITRSESLRGVIDGKLYVFGGFNGANGPVVRSDVYNPATNTWTRIKDLPARLTHVGVAVVGREIWFAGGYTGIGPGYQQTFATRNVWIYNVDTDTYRAGPLLPVARGSGALVYNNGFLHFFNGVDSSRNDRGEHWKLQVGTTNWVSAKANTDPRSHLGFVSLNGKIYAIGGQHDTDANLVTRTTTQVYDPANDTWTDLKALPRGVSHISSSTFVMGGRIIVVGGEYAHTKPVADVLAYDPEFNTWTKLTSLPFNSGSAVADVINGAIYNTTGSSGKTYVGQPVG